MRALAAMLLLASSAPLPAQREAPATSRLWTFEQVAPAGGGGFVPVEARLAEWERLRRDDGSATLAELQRFVVANPTWPQTGAMRRRAERIAADAMQSSGGEALAFFAALPPETAMGRARMAMLLADAGRTADALPMARRAWVSSGLDGVAESLLLARFGGQFTRADHSARLEMLLWAGQTSAAQRMLALVPDERRVVALARIALRTNAMDAEARAASVPAALLNDPGLVFDRTNWLQRQGNENEARRYMAAMRIDPGGVSHPEAWLRERLELGRAAMRDGDYQVAYRLLAGHQAFPLGRLLADRPLSERTLFTDAEWLAGWIALRRLNRLGDAVANFQNFRAAVLTPVSRARGDYWIGRAFAAAGNGAAARQAWERAAEHPDFFYGQIAAETLGRTPALPRVPAPEPTPADRLAFGSDGLVAAARLLAGDRQRQALFLRAIAETVDTPGEARLAADLARALNRPDLAVRVGRNARSDGMLGLVDAGYPRLDTAALPSDLWLISHAIARQESFFDRTAESSAGARGLMQLMPGTAADVARRLGLEYDRQRLFDDPSYNLTLGSSYYGQRVRDFGGNHMLAIAAYNAGAGNVRKWLNAYGDPRGRSVEEVVDWVEMIPFTETRNYVQRVVENAVVYSMIEPRRVNADPRATAWLGVRS